MKSTMTLKSLAALALVLVSTTCRIAPSYANDDPVPLAVIVSNDVDTLYKSVTDLIVAGKFDQATALVDSALKANPKNAMAYFCKASIVYADYRNLNEVLPYLNDAVALDPKLEPAILVRARILKAMNDYRAAVRDFDAVIALDAANSEAMDNSIEIKTALRDWKGLIDDLNTKIAMNPSDAESYFKRGYCEEQLGETGEALSDFKESKHLYIAAKDDVSAQAVDQYITSARTST